MILAKCGVLAMKVRVLAGTAGINMPQTKLRLVSLCVVANWCSMSTIIF